MSKIIYADALEGLRQLDSECVDVCVTSPPYYGLRDYGVAGQIGLEETPEKYIDRLTSVFREVRRVLKSDGTLWIVIADSYSGSGKGAGQDPENAKKYKQSTNRGSVGVPNITKVTTPGIKPKNLIGIPWLLAFALRNDGWYLRDDIIWVKPNPMPESVKDRCTKSYEHIFMLSKSPRYYFDAVAISEPTAESTTKRLSQNVEAQSGSSRAYGKTNCVDGGVDKFHKIVPYYASVRYGFEVDTSTVGQATGLTDKNGMRIFEGDIVSGWYNHERIVGYIFYGSDASFFIQRDGLYGIRLNNAEIWLEVIGNIHDNPELLKGEEE